MRVKIKSDEGGFEADELGKKWRPKCLTLDADTGEFLLQLNIQLDPNRLEKDSIDLE